LRVLFERRLREGIHDGRIVLAFRRWKRCQVVTGHRYRTRADLIVVDSVDIVTAASINADQARQAGYATVGELLADLRGEPELPLYRIRFRRIDEPDPRDLLAASPALAADDLAALTARLARMDAAGTRGPWTRIILTQIADHPGTVSTVLAQALGWERQDFKVHVRRLKELGLTISLDVGYRLSPRGEAYLFADPPAQIAP
jgi:biotin operon repressor